jgi:hypothetical protein
MKNYPDDLTPEDDGDGKPPVINPGNPPPTPPVKP